MTVTRAEGRSSLSRRARRQTWIGLAFLAPAFAFIVAFVAYPVITAAVLSFHQWDGVSARVFTGAANWVRLASDTVFWGSLGRNVLIAVVAVVFQVGLAMVIAYWLVRMVPRVKRVAMFLYVVPVVVSERAPRSFTRPRSATCGRPSSEERMFSGFRSRWTRPILCALPSAWQI